MIGVAAADLAGLRIGHLIESDGPAGAGRVLADLTTALGRAGVEVVAFLPVGGEGWLTRELTARGAIIEHYPPGRPVATDVQDAVAAGVRRHRVMLLHSHDWAMGVAGSWVARRHHIPHVITMHGSRSYAASVRRRVALRVAASLSTALVAATHALAAQLRHDLMLLRGGIDVIPNGVAPRRPQAPARLRGDLRLKPHDRLVLAVGNLTADKAHRDLFDAIALLPPPLETTHVAIAGRGDLARDLMAHAADLGIADRVHLLGLRTDIPELLADADVFALPSHAEGLSIALLEAMDAGVPIVATDVGETAMVLDHGGAGLVVPSHVPGALSSAIARLLSRPGEAARLAAAARERVRTAFSHTTMVQRYRALYQAAIASAEPLDRAITLRPAPVLSVPQPTATSGSVA